MKSHQKKNRRSHSTFYFLDSIFCNQGQMLIEAMVAISILIVAVFTILGFLSRSISLNRVTADQYVGTYLGAEAIEIVRGLIDTNVSRCNEWNRGLSNGTWEADYIDTKLELASGAPLRFDGNFYQYNNGENSKFIRTIELQNLGAANQELKAVARVSWKNRGGARSDVTLEDHFFNWRAKPARCF